VHGAEQAGVSAGGASRAGERYRLVLSVGDPVTAQRSSPDFTLVTGVGSALQR
jgi:hypothetical protein